MFIEQFLILFANTLTIVSDVKYFDDIFRLNIETSTF